MEISNEFKMNFENILKDFGYILVSKDDEKKTFDIKFTEEKKFEKCKSVDFDLSRYEFNLNDIFTVKIDEVGFDGHGNLYICLDQLDGGCWDVLEYTELYL
ncbi:hypothetical protein JK636_18690 [Clostridium sp. YIM B02515]|uniref:Uncharacterized protein n=1 Tax=Clostridium rhizosphaerae TaxID=2803861 RepID=A0ABS1TER8_9CLOT|nr:hypothetical protein [Clostridium rhizosphaerae]MBL4937736.1 hypothetical protein [Clostridium rhizosphaerae]